MGQCGCEHGAGAEVGWRTELSALAASRAPNTHVCSKVLTAEGLVVWGLAGVLRTWRAGPRQAQGGQGGIWVGLGREFSGPWW